MDVQPWRYCPYSVQIRHLFVANGKHQRRVCEAAISQHAEPVRLTLKLHTRDVVLVGASQMPKTTAGGLFSNMSFSLRLGANLIWRYLTSNFSRRSDLHIGAPGYDEEGWKHQVSIYLVTGRRFSGGPQEACTGNVGRNFCRIDRAERPECLPSLDADSRPLDTMQDGVNPPQGR
ncbi:uncharacterized protein LY79DRAFT_167216 [Colletotrichum navitas]|uniref:Uncharacterized protein n=1 Tax=Colletotrichum navitas TaxID=681940 RepID=A0AAD8Q1M6_9PEZI|nr:uncharacterized protein LY79DRAFT_167216 [Colletotrichum navitas]KAK1594023.1 hypothetical protein LY79DRAFT_167216 [Colletotrichum navitas]